MKIAKSLLPALLAVSAGTAYARSSVTLYGTIDEGFDYISNQAGHSNYALTSNLRQLGDRWGVKGSEDLGGGLHAIFRLENNFSVSTGQLADSGEMFGRQAYVGLSSDRLGTVTLGRQYDSVVDYVAPLSAAGSWGGGLFGHPFDADNLDESFRINNAVKYTSADISGVQLGGLYGFSNQAGQFATNRAWSVGARYDGGPLKAAAAYMNAGGEDQNTSGAVVGSPYHAGTQRVAAAGLSYALGSATLGLVYTHTTLDAAPQAGILRNVKFDNVEVNAKYDFSSAFYVGVMYLYTDATVEVANRHNDPHDNEIGATAGYHLSRRTEVYAQALYQHASGNQVASIAGLGDSSSRNQTVTRVGIRTAF
ncbi:MAG: porin [Burkholderia gladioli]